MRKIIPFVLAVALLLSMTLSSAATQITEENPAGTGEVKANYVPGEETGTVISVEIKWEGMKFTYNDASEPVWDAEKHQYSEKTEAAWSKSDAYISITNHSNVMLQSQIEYTQGNGYKEMDLFFTDKRPYIGSADVNENAAGEECAVIIRTIPTGKLPSSTPEDAVVGEIKVTVNSVEDYNQVISDINSLYSKVNVKDGNTTLSRGTAYFESQTVKEQVYGFCVDAEDVLANSESIPEKNAALNAAITSYYNNLYLMQD